METPTAQQVNEPPADTVTIPVPPTPAPPPAPEAPAGDARFTADDLTRVRQQEKDKLYGQLSQRDEAMKKLEEQLAVLAAERDARLKAEEEARAAVEDAARKKSEAEMSAKALVEKRTAELADQLAAIQREREAERALYDREREYGQLREYMTQRVAAERETIAPELIDLVTGTTPEEVDASIKTLQDKTAAIITGIQQAQVAARAQMRGVAPTAPTTGPMDNEPGTRTYSVDDLKKMSMSDFIKNRQALLGAAAGKANRGLYG